MGKGSTQRWPQEAIGVRYWGGYFVSHRGVLYRGSVSLYIAVSEEPRCHYHVAEPTHLKVKVYVKPKATLSRSLLDSFIRSLRYASQYLILECTLACVALARLPRALRRRFVSA